MNDRTRQIAHRQADNRRILDQLRAAVDAHPDLRFGQLLVGFDVLLLTDGPAGQHQARDPFNEEPEVTLERMRRSPLWAPEADRG